MKHFRLIGFFSLFFLCFGVCSSCGGDLFQTGGPNVFHESNSLENDFGVPILWDHYPIVVDIDSRYLTPEQINIVIFCINQWNTTAEGEILSYRITNNLSGDFDDVYITSGSLNSFPDANGHSHKYLGLTTRRFKCDALGQAVRMQHALVQLEEKMFIYNWRVVVLHELGHVLGLNHDQTTQESVMWPYALDSLGTIMPEDVIYIRSLLHPGIRR